MIPSRFFNTNVKYVIDLSFSLIMIFSFYDGMPLKRLIGTIIFYDAGAETAIPYFPDPIEFLARMRI